MATNLEIQVLPLGAYTETKDVRLDNLNGSRGTLVVVVTAAANRANFSPVIRRVDRSGNTTDILIGTPILGPGTYEYRVDPDLPVDDPDEDEFDDDQARALLPRGLSILFRQNNGAVSMTMSAQLHISE